MSPTESEYRLAVASTYRKYGYVVTGFDNDGIAGFDNAGQLVNMTWDEAAGKLLKILVKRGSFDQV